MVQTIFIGLVLSSTLTGLITEGIKTILDDIDETYSSNILAAIVAVITGAALGAAYIICTESGFTLQNIIAVIALSVLTFLCATLGYDKVIQTLTQIGGGE